MQRVVVTGLGAITPLGLGIRRSWQRLLDGECGIVSLESRGKQFTSQRCRVAGLVPQGSKFEGAWNNKEWLSGDEIRKTSEFMQYAIYAAGEAFEDADWVPRTNAEQEYTGICLGSGIGSLRHIYETSIDFYQGGAKKVSPLFVPKLLINVAAGHISIKYGLKGPCHAATTACTTGAHSIGDAARFIAHNDANVMLAGGSESCIDPLAFVGFERSRSLTTAFNDNPAMASRPFDRARSGFVIGEGAAVLVLESLDHALERGAPQIYAELVGYGTSSDAHHLTAPPPDGNGALRAMRIALRHANLAPREVDYINAHATSTILGDVAENRAIKRLMLGDAADNKASEGAINVKASPEQINVSSTKGAVGHLLGAAGALEAAFTLLAVKEDVLPPTLNLDPNSSQERQSVENPASNLSSGLSDEPEAEAIAETEAEEFNCNYVPGVKQEKTVNVALSNSFGFGGTNASLCFRKFHG